MCLKIHKIPTVLFIDENTASKEFSFTDFFSKNSNRINDQGAITEILHVLDKCDRSNWSAVLKTILSCKSIFSITKLFLVSKLSWRSGSLTRGSCMAIICLTYSHFYHAVDSTYISCSPLRWHFYHGFRGVFYRVDGCLLPGWWRAFLKDARVFTLQVRGKNIQDDLATRKDFWLADFDQRWLDMKRLQGHYYVKRGRGLGKNVWQGLKKKLQGSPPRPGNSKCPSFNKLFNFDPPLPPIIFRCWWCSFVFIMGCIKLTHQYIGKSHFLSGDPSPCWDFLIWPKQYYYMLLNRAWFLGSWVVNRVYNLTFYDLEQVVIGPF